MSVERVIYCDGEGRETHIRTTRNLPAGFLRVAGFGQPLYFCSWDCVLKFAAKQEPIEEVPFHD